MSKEQMGPSAMADAKEFDATNAGADRSRGCRPGPCLTPQCTAPPPCIAPPRCGAPPPRPPNIK